MKTFPARGVWLTLSLCLLTASVWSQDFGSPSLLYPQYGNQPITVGYGRLNTPDDLPSPSDTPPAVPMMNAPMGGPMGAPMAPMNGGMEYGSGYSGGYNTYPAPGPAPVPNLNHGYQPGAYQPGADFHNAMSSPEGSCGFNGGYDGFSFGGCGDCGGGGCCRGGWFGYAGGLIMTRSDNSCKPLSYNAAGYQVLNTNQVEQPWMGGFEAAFGKWFCGCRVGLEVVYWGLFPSTQSYDYSGAGTYSAINYGGLWYNGQPYNNYWNAAQRQYIRRDNTFNNVELNFIGNAWNLGGCGCGSYIAGYGGGGCCDDNCFQSCGGCGGCNVTVGWLAGVRYFDFTDNFYYASSTADTVIDGTPDEVFYVNNVKNSLVGFQMGGYVSYQFCCRWSVYGGAKAGLYNNHSNLYKRLYGTNGDAMIYQGPYTNSVAAMSSTANNLAALGQFDLGLRWQATCHFAMRAGYRVVGISGLALSDDQLLYNYADYPAYSCINTNGSVILHGAYAGGEFCW